MNPTRLAVGLIACCSLFAGSFPARALTARQGPYELEVLVGGAPARTWLHRGETYLLGRLGERYTLRIQNRSDRRVEAVVSIDGRDVIDGKPAEFRHKRGYLVEAWSTVEIDGWRISQSEAAAFRFSRVADSYAARTGSAREVGVIGVAIFPERWVPPPRPLASPLRDDSYGPAEAERRSESAPAPSAAPAEPSSKADGAMANRSAAKTRQRPGLGTEFGEAVASQVNEVPFERADPSSPASVLGARYNDRDGLIALGVPVEPRPSWSEADLRRTASPFPAEDRFARPPPGWHR